MTVRIRLLAGALLLPALLAAQAPEYPRDDSVMPERLRIVRLPTGYEPSDCHLAALVAEVAWRARVPVGLQSPEACFGRVLQGQGEGLGPPMEATEALRYLVSQTPGYTQMEMGGVLVIRRDEAWRDARDPLNARVPPFTASAAGPDDIIIRVFDLPSTSRRSDGPVRSLTFPGGSRLDLLNAVVSAYGHAGSTWNVAPTDARRFRIAFVVRDLSFEVYWEYNLRRGQNGFDGDERRVASRRLH